MECEELEDLISCKDDYIWSRSTSVCEYNKVCKIEEYFDTQNCSCKKRLIGKLVLACENEILNTTKTPLDDKNVTCEKIIFSIT